MRPAILGFLCSFSLLAGGCAPAAHPGAAPETPTPTCEKDPSGCEQEEPTCEEDPSGCEQEEPTCEEDPSSCEQEEPTCEEDPSPLCPPACDEGATRCVEGSIHRCLDGSWVDEGACPFACSNGACVGSCQPGALRCDGSTAQACLGGTWTDLADCPFLCAEGICAGACVPGDVRCDGNQPLRCDETGVWQEDGPACAHACVDGACAGDCVPGTRSCAGPSMVHCSDAGVRELVGTCAHTCEAGYCAGSCKPGATRCAGAALEVCGASAEWQLASTCSSLCSDACPDCLPGATRCGDLGLERCGDDGRWGQADPCPSGTSCEDGACVEPIAPSCAQPGPGRSDCGPNGDETCCASAFVPGGPFLFDNDPNLLIEVSPFRLDLHEITVGRFRAFVEAVESGWQPPPGAGRHAHLNGGAGLFDPTSGSNESGWDPSWQLPTKWDESLSQAYGLNWTSTPGPNERRAMNGLHWHEAFAFCIWDGGFLPSEAEWSFAATGGGDGDGQRAYPWGQTWDDPDRYAVHMGSCPGGFCDRPIEVGTRPEGAGRWGHLDLAGNAGEWVLDWYQDAPAPCTDCALLTPPRSTGSMRAVRGGWTWDFYPVPSSVERTYGSPDHRVIGVGARCARAP